MSRAEVVAALDEYLALLGERDVPVASRLRPGLSRADIEEREASAGLELPDEVAAVWEWHDGVEGAETEPGSTSVLFVPHGRFCSMTSSIESGRALVELSEQGNPDTDLRGRRFVTLIGFQNPRVIECTPGAQPLTFLSDPASPLTDFPVLTIADRVRWWSWAVREGAWSIEDDGQWHVDFSKYLPGYLNVF